MYCHMISGKYPCQRSLGRYAHAACPPSTGLMVRRWLISPWRHPPWQDPSAVAPVHRGKRTESKRAALTTTRGEMEPAASAVRLSSDLAPEKRIPCLVIQSAQGERHNEDNAGALHARMQARGGAVGRGQPESGIGSQDPWSD
jgi:hypothetical protein